MKKKKNDYMKTQEKSKIGDFNEKINYSILYFTRNKKKSTGDVELSMKLKLFSKQQMNTK